MTNKEKLELIEKRFDTNSVEFDSITLDEGDNVVRIKVFKDKTFSFGRKFLRDTINYLKSMFNDCEVFTRFVTVEEYPWYDEFEVDGVSHSKFIMEFECVKKDKKVAIYRK